MDGITIYQGDDGVFHEYKDDFDMTLHFETEEERNTVLSDMVSRKHLLEIFGELGDINKIKALTLVETAPSMFENIRNENREE